MKSPSLYDLGELHPPKIRKQQGVGLQGRRNPRKSTSKWELQGAFWSSKRDQRLSMGLAQGEPTGCNPIQVWPDGGPLVGVECSHWCSGSLFARMRSRRVPVIERVWGSVCSRDASLRPQAFESVRKWPPEFKGGESCRTVGAEHV